MAAAIKVDFSQSPDFNDGFSPSSLPALSLWKRFLGNWRLVSWEQHDETGGVIYPLGPDAVGQLIYDDSGRMSAQLMRRNPLRFASEDRQYATAEEKAAAWDEYFGYFGTFVVDEDAQAVIHHIEGSWFPNMVGANLVRYYRFEGNQLILDTGSTWSRMRIVWEKNNSNEMSYA